MQLTCGLEVVADGGPGCGVPAQFHEGEGEGLLHFIGPGVAGGAGRFQIDLADQQAVRLVLLGEGAPAAVDLVDFLLVRDLRVGPQPVYRTAGGGGVRHALGLEQGMRDVDAEPVHALVEPELQHVVEVVADGGAFCAELPLPRSGQAPLHKREPSHLILSSSQ
ncbi:MAG: hypothetical protein JWO49_1 [Arthrobacter sp.]|nr:hypothetical protein [Arthrobacter sp.]